MSAERYEFIKAIVDGGDLDWEYRLTGRTTDGRTSHDDDVSELTDDDIRELTASMLDVEPDQVALIEIRHS